MQAKIKVKNGYWTYNGKPLVKCTFPERQIVSQFIRNSIFNIELEDQSETKRSVIDLSEYNYDFDFIKC
jgi:hypothetical protein